MKEEQVIIKLKKEEALVLFEFVTEFTKDIPFENRNSDTYALWGLESALEKELAEPFLKNYGKIIIDARKKLEEFYRLK